MFAPRDGDGPAKWRLWVFTGPDTAGSRNDDAARLAARIRAVTATAEMAGLTVTACLTACPGACGRNSGKPPPGTDPGRFLPWNAGPAGKEARSQPPRPG